jgi:hypothetical protein
MCLPSRCLETNVVSELFSNNGYFSMSTVLAFSKYATLLNLFKLCEHKRKHTRITTVFRRHTAESSSVAGDRIWLRCLAVRLAKQEESESSASISEESPETFEVTGGPIECGH